MSATLSMPLPAERHAWVSNRLLLVLPALILVFFFLVLPYLNIVLMSFRMPSSTAPYGPGFTLNNYARAIADPFHLAILGRTFVICILVTAVCFLIGLPVAYHLARTHSRLRPFLYAGILAPLLVAAVIRLYGWMIILANKGLINVALMQWGLVDRPVPLMYNEFGVIVGLVHINLPFMILPLLGALQGVNPSIEEAAQSLGASRTTIMRRVVLPLAIPGIVAGSVLVFVHSASSFITPVMLGGSRVKLMTPIVVQQLAETFMWPFGAALAIVLAAAGGLAVFAWMRVTQPLIKGEA